ncbi:M60 family metallopeptidase [Brasilonema sp. UFV-L1]|uniref:M60 family metallopeptidase n=1 Tax=Brasilonema sp. UFV-L1 TaxID=2234130 RepID=UPI00145FC8DE|nr:M60 family metallopeptidase [Brasilonema sp. UFV-L1]NMG07122.1 hypothetical protein [Brasilonema sp. UFV-L1]
MFAKVLKSLLVFLLLCLFIFPSRAIAAQVAQGITVVSEQGDMLISGRTDSGALLCMEANGNSVIAGICRGDLGRGDLVQQLWSMDDQGHLKSLADVQQEKCLDGGSLSSGTKTTLTSCKDTSGQLWQYDNGVFRSKSNNQRVLDGGYLGANILIYGYNGYRQQHWSWGKEDREFLEANLDKLPIRYPIALSDTFTQELEKAQFRQGTFQPPTKIISPPDVSDFPGNIEPGAEIVNKTIEFDRVFNDREQFRMSQPPKNWKITGLYARPAEELIVNVKNATRQDLKGVKVRMNTHTDELAPDSKNVKQDGKFKRPPIVTLRLPLEPGQNQVRNQYGGLIFLESTDSADKVLDIEIQDAVEAPHYIHGVTTPEQWRTIRNNPAPWAVIETTKVVVVVPSSDVRNLDNQESLGSMWDNIVGWVSELAGFSENPALPHRTPQGKQWLVMDKQISAGSAHAGIPIMFSPGYKLADVNAISKSGRTGWGVWHELGHNYQQPLWASTFGGESTVNLYSLYVQEKLGEPDELIKRKDYIKAINLLNDPNITDKFNKAGDWGKLVFLMQIKHAFPEGWDIYKELNKRYRELSANEVAQLKDDQAKRDKFYILMSDITGHDLTSHFDKWAIGLSSAARQTVQNMNLPQPSQNIWEINPEKA